MRKATQKSAPVSLGTKRACPKCNTKFYDFNKEDVVCPKCEVKLDLQSLTQPFAPRPEPKKAPRPVEKDPETPVLEGEEVIGTATDDFESVEDLEDEEDDVVEDIEVDDEQEY